MLERGWSASEDEVLSVRVLTWAHEKADGRTTPILGSFLPEDASNEEARHLVDLAQVMADNGLVRIGGRLAGPIASSIDVTAAGLDELRRHAETAGNPKARAVGCREALLDWLYVQKRAGAHMPNVDGFLQDPRSWFHGSQFTDQEVQDAGEHLAHRAFIGTTGALGRPVIRALIEALGEQVVEEFDGSLARWSAAERRGGSQFVTHFHGDVTGQVGVGESVVQTQNNGIDGELVARLLNEVREAALRLPIGDQAYFLTYVDVLQAEASTPSPDRSLLQGSLDRLKALSAKAGDAALSGAVGALIQALLGG